jgi:glucosamine-6-phosphate deaminase
MPVDALRGQARLPFRLLADIPAVMNDFARSIADVIQFQNERREPTRLILPVGPVKQYPLLAEITNRERISWRNVFTFNMDEFLNWQGRPITVDHPLSFEGFMRRELFARIDPALQIPEVQCFFPHPFRIDEISEKIREVGGIDCCFGGIGYHGHVAFNEPPLSRWHNVTVEEFRESLTRVITLGDDSIVVQSIHSAGGDSSAIPPMAVTAGHQRLRRCRLHRDGWL